MLLLWGYWVSEVGSVNPRKQARTGSERSEARSGEGETMESYEISEAWRDVMLTLIDYHN